MGAWLSNAVRALGGCVAARARWVVAILFVLGLLLVPAPSNSPTLPMPQSPSPVTLATSGTSNPLVLSEDWRRYVSGPPERDVSPSAVIRSEGISSPESMLAPDGRHATTSPESLVVVDFGQVVSGKVELSLGSGSTGDLVLSFSESLRFLRPGGDESRYGLGDLSYTPVSVVHTWTSPYRRTFRYLLIRTTGSAKIDAVGLYFTPPLWPSPGAEGRFLSDDDELNDIWYHGIYTLQLTTATGTATDADGTWEPVRGKLDVASSSWRSVAFSTGGNEWSDYSFCFDLTMAPGSPEEGWLFRATDNGFYLWELAQPVGGGPAELRRSSYRDGAYTSLGVKKLDREVVPGRPVAVCAELSGSTIVTRLDGAVIDTTVADTFGRGVIGFRAVGGQHYYVDNVRVTGGSGVLFSDDFDSDHLDTGRWTAARSLALLDGAKRDRAVGAADLAIAARTHYAAGGDPRLVRDIILALAHLQSPSGKIQGGLYGPNPTTEETPHLKDFSLWWILVLRDYVLQSGDMATLREVAGALDRNLAWAEKQARPDGLLDKGPGLDWYWTWPNRGGVTTYFNVLYAGALEAAVDLYRWLGRDVSTLQAEADRVHSIVNSALWDAVAGVYVDSDSLRASHPLDGNALAVYFGVAPPDRSASLLAYLRKALWTRYGSVTSDQPIPSEYHNGTIWPAVVYYEVEARFASGDVDGAYELLHRTWGNMLKVDPASTFWEFARSDGQVYDGFDSLAHGWSTGPVSALTRRALGVRPIEPGYSATLVAPQPGPLRWAEGRIPTPRGNLDVSWRRDGDVFVLSLVVPEGMRAMVGVPAGPAPVLDGVPVAPEDPPSFSLLAGLDPSPRLFVTVGPGTHTIATEYRGH